MTEEPLNTYAQKVLDLCQQKKISLYKLSKLTGVHQSTLSRWRRGLTSPSGNTLALVMATLDHKRAPRVFRKETKQPEVVEIIDNPESIQQPEVVMPLESR